MATYGGGLKAYGAATTGQVLTSSQCACCTYLGATTTNATVVAVQIWFGPGQTIPTTIAGSLGYVGSFAGGAVFSN